MTENDTIAAVSTSVGLGGIAIVRLSGPSAVKIADDFFCAKSGIKLEKAQHAKMNFGEFCANGFEEKGYCVVFFAPNSFTGETVVELQVHGGYVVAQKILEECITRGARLAEKGEFSKRAFLNGKASLDSLEGMIQMINAESEAELRAASVINRGKLGEKVKEAEDILTTALAGIEVGIDYPDEVEEEPTKEQTVVETKKALEIVDDILKTKNVGHVIFDGATVAIVGKPNVGKSSLLNAMIGEDRAIVTDIPGTTRDVVKERFVYDGVKFCFLDTAGIRSTDDVVEKIGVGRAKQTLDDADIILFVLDGSLPISDEDKEIAGSVKDKNTILVLNKADKNKKTETKKFFDDWNGDKIEVSAQTLENTDKLLKMMKQKVCGGDTNGIVISNKRHIEALEEAKTELEKIEATMPIDILAFCLRSAIVALGKISGKTASEEVVAKVFSKFCVGK